MRSRDNGSVLLTTAMVSVLAAALGLIAVLAVQRSLSTEQSLRRDLVVERLARSGIEEVVGRIVAPGGGLAVALAHPGLGTGTGPDDGPWVRYATDGQVVACSSTDARQECFTVRIAGYPDLAEPADVEELLVQVSARKCRAANPASASCVRAREQATLRARAFTLDTVWVDGVEADVPMFVTGDSVAGSLKVNAGSITYCGTPTVGTVRLSVGASTVAEASSGCVASGVPATAGNVVTSADSVPIPVGDADEFVARAGLVVSSVSGAGKPVIEIVDGTFTVDGGTAQATPGTGLIWVDDDVEVRMSDGHPLTGDLTIAASGSVTVTSDLLLADSTSSMLGIVSTGGDIIIEYTETARVVQALLVATAPAPYGRVRASEIEGCVESSCVTSALSLTGAVVARRVSPTASTGADGVASRGFTKQWVYDSRFARQQPPSALYPIRSSWVRVDRVTTRAGGLGI